MARRCIGLDVHREFAQVAIWGDGVVRQAGQVSTAPAELRLFADSLGAGDEVALEATGNSYPIATLLTGRVARVVVSNPKKTRAIAEAKVKTRSTRRFWRSSSPRTTCRACGYPMRRRTRCAGR